MELVGARFCGDIYDATRSATVFCAEVAGGNTKFLYRIQGHSLANLCVESVDVLGAIEQHIGTGGPLAINVDARTAARRHRTVRFLDIAGGGDKIVGIAVNTG